MYECLNFILDFLLSRYRMLSIVIGFFMHISYNILLIILRGRKGLGRVSGYRGPFYIFYGIFFICNAIGPCPSDTTVTRFSNFLVFPERAHRTALFITVRTHRGFVPVFLSASDFF
jgi:hypothetical protein